MALRALLLDFNSYFASVEQHLRPELRGRPLGVLPVMAETSCCIAASREAKRSGVKTGTGVMDARRLCPEIVFVQARPRVYVEMHHRLMDVVDSIIAVSEVLSIDEVACDLTGSWRRESVVRELALTVKAKLRDHVGEVLTCSIGVGPNRFLAKTASNMQKPDGLVVMNQEDLPDCLFRLKLNDLNGIAGAMLERLERHGIGTVEALCRADRAHLRRVWGGVEGERMYDRLRGEAVVLPPAKRSSLSHSHVLPPHLRHDAGAFSVLSKLTQKAALRLRAEGYLSGRLGVRVSYRRHADWGMETRFAPMQDTLACLRLIAALWAQRPLRREPVKVGMVFGELVPRDKVSLPLFPDGTRAPGLDAALDRIRLKFGAEALYFGGAFLAQEEAPMRISFTHIPNLKLEADGKAGGLDDRALLEV